MPLSREARIEIEPSHISYPAWWVVPLPNQGLPAIAAATDVVCILAVSVLAGMAYHLIALRQTGDLAQFAGSGIAVAASFTFAAHARGLYRPSELPRMRLQLGEAVKIWIAVFLFLSTVVFALKVSDAFSRGAVLSFFFGGLSIILVYRVGLARLVPHLVSSGQLNCQRVVLLVDASWVARQEIASNLQRHGYILSRVFSIAGSLENTGVDASTTDQIVEAVRYVRQRCPDEVVLAFPWHRKALITRIARQLSSVAAPVRLLADPDIKWLLERPILELGATKAVEIQRRPLRAPQRAIKRLLDLALAGLGVVLTLPFLLLTAIAIKLDSSGPVLFRQARIGFNGRPFRIYKFRTMTTLEDGPGIRQARKDDQRVTRVGRVLRRFSLDELPQLVNVLRGEMSLVGPRPHALAHDDEYSRLITEYATRHKIKPGITGWAQVNSCRGETPHVEAMRRRVSFDLDYIESWSVWLDFRILVMTSLQVLRDRNAY